MEFMLVVIGLVAAFFWGLCRLWGRDGLPRPEAGAGTRNAASLDMGSGNSRYISHDDDVFSNSGSNVDDDWYTNPLYSFYPFNIYHHDDTPIGGSSTGIDNDWMTDPTCSYLPGNIYHDDHFGCGSSLTDDSFTDTSSSMFDDDSFTNSSSSLPDDSWSSSSSDDSWSSSTNDD